MVVDGARAAWWAQIVATSTELVSSPEFVFWELRELEEDLWATAVVAARALEVDARAAAVGAVPPWDAPERQAVIAAQASHRQALSDQRTFLLGDPHGKGDAYARLRCTAGRARSHLLEARVRWVYTIATLYAAKGGVDPDAYVEYLESRLFAAFKEGHRVDGLTALAEAQAERSRAAQPLLGSGAAWALAEEVAAAALQVMGFPDAAVTDGGADGGLDVEGRGVVAQVKYLARPVGRPELQRLAGANQHGAQAVFFSRSGYASAAVAFADAVGMALFTIELPATVRPVNNAAIRLYQDADVD